MTIDEQIQELERQKHLIVAEEAKKKKDSLDEYARTLIGKAFMKYGGMNSCGQMQFTFLLAVNYTHGFGNECIQGKQIGVNLDAAAIYGWTNYNREWSDSEYRKSGGNNKWESNIEDAIFSRTQFHVALEKEVKGSKYQRTKNINSVSIQHFTPYNWDNKIESKESWEYYWKEIPMEEWNRVLGLAEEVHNYIWSSFADIIQGKLKSHDKVLLHPTDTEKSYAVIDKLDAFLNSPMSQDFKNKQKAVQEILKNS